MTKEEFIIECAMRNLQAAITSSGTLQCTENPVVERCIKLAKNMADKLYKHE